jgi:putative ABC transport system substrate-binding protein
MQFNQLRRREFITLLGGAAAGWPLVARAQQRANMRRIGVYMSVSDDDNAELVLQAFRQELERLGWSAGGNVRIDYRFEGGNSDRIVPLAQELVTLQPDVILAQSTKVTAALQRQTQVIPIVFNHVSDPIGAGFVASLARPGTNLTGVLLYEYGITGKWLAMLKEIAPHLTRVALIGNPNTSPFDYFRGAAEAAATALNLTLVPTPVENNDADIVRAIEAFASTSNGGLMVLPDPITTVRRDLVISLAARHHLPAIYAWDYFVRAGGLMSYGTDRMDIFRLSASFIDRILRGSKAADLPVQAPTKYVTVLNLKTAMEIGLNVPPSMLVRADEVIE